MGELEADRVVVVVSLLLADVAGVGPGRLGAGEGGAVTTVRVVVVVVIVGVFALVLVGG